MTYYYSDPWRPGPRERRWMNLEYSNTLDDLIAFQKFHIENSTSIRSTYRRSAVVLGGCLFIVWIAGGGGLPVALAWGIAGTLLFPKLFLKLCVMGALKTARRLYAEGRNVGTLGWHRLSITEKSLREESEAGVGEIQFEAV